jgi:hypothetical protein
MIRQKTETLEARHILFGISFAGTPAFMICFTMGAAIFARATPALLGSLKKMRTQFQRLWQNTNYRQRFRRVLKLIGFIKVQQITITISLALFGLIGGCDGRLKIAKRQPFKTDNLPNQPGLTHRAFYCPNNTASTSSASKPRGRPRAMSASTLRQA